MSSASSGDASLDAQHDIGFSHPLRKFRRFVAFEHSVFALPFAYLSALTAMFSLSGRVDWPRLALITVAMVGARTFAMATNRMIDRQIDARNPRTAQRELVTGAMSLRSAWLGAALALAVFLAAAGLLSPLCLALAPVAAVILVIYPYAKRFTWAPHAFLGLAQAIGPIGAWIGVTNGVTWPAAMLGIAVGLWIGGFDLIYSCQDVESDRQQGVHSIPADFSIGAALLTARAAHVLTFALYAAFGYFEGFGLLWWIGLTGTALAFVYEHALVSPSDLSKVNRAFFTVNGFVGIWLFCWALADLALRGLRP
ncbi:MAG TPA: menaquinone biosynthesis prenyltransferase MqnP [Chloroflexota bacterium]|nr:menaquinone biosynthesis prenyltransferase MqnP [Chloroflexota bacterium]